MSSGSRGPVGRALAHADLARNLFVTRRNPVSVVHFVTNRCNARCPFCFIDFDDPAVLRQQMRIEDIEVLAQSLGPNLTNVNLTGGEPFARKDLIDVARCYFRHTGIESIFITTNGSLPDRIETFIRTLQAEFPDRKLIFSFSIDELGAAHDDIRRIKGLFDNCIDSFRRVQSFGGNVFGNISITVSLSNADTAPATYESLIDDYGVDAITCVAVRDEGVYATPPDDKKRILVAYSEITHRIRRDIANGRLSGYNPKTLQGRLMNRKNEIMYQTIEDIYLEPEFKSYCYAGSLFGVIAANGDVYPCEILDRPLGNLRDYDFNFMRLWRDATAQDTRKWIRDTKCTCTYECAWSFNILANYQYLPRMARAALDT